MSSQHFYLKIYKIPILFTTFVVCALYSGITLYRSSRQIRIERALLRAMLLDRKVKKMSFFNTFNILKELDKSRFHYRQITASIQPAFLRDLHIVQAFQAQFFILSKSLSDSNGLISMSTVFPLFKTVLFFMSIMML